MCVCCLSPFFLYILFLYRRTGCLQQVSDPFCVVSGPCESSTWSLNLDRYWTKCTTETPVVIASKLFVPSAQPLPIAYPGNLAGSMLFPRDYNLGAYTRSARSHAGRKEEWNQIMVEWEAKAAETATPYPRVAAMSISIIDAIVEYGGGAEEEGERDGSNVNEGDVGAIELIPAQSSADANYWASQQLNEENESSKEPTFGRPALEATEDNSKNDDDDVTKVNNEDRIVVRTKASKNPFWMAPAFLPMFGALGFALIIVIVLILLLMAGPEAEYAPDDYYARTVDWRDENRLLPHITIKGIKDNDVSVEDKWLMAANEAVPKYS